MSVEEIVRLISLSVSLLISLIGLLIAILKAIKNKKWDDLQNALEQFVEQTGSLDEESGDEKKNEVLCKAQDFCNKQHIKFEEEKINQLIDDLISLSKQVNQQEKEDTGSKIKSATNEDVESTKKGDE